jgi:malonyl-CoA O-methyltransferase
LGGSGEFRKILDIGCGTGNYTRVLRNRFVGAEIKALDISAEMIEAAERKLAGSGINFVVADAETVALSEKFDLITSNACFQWFEYLEAGLVKYRSLLNEGGTILFSMFGPVTFCELSELLEKLYKGNAAISSGAFIGRERVEEMLRKYFDEVFTTDEIRKERYGSLLELLNAIKYTGTRGVGLNGKRMGRDKIAELERMYRERFEDIVATYQIFYCRGKVRD